jgi:SAM-dependent methyltransferase
VNTSISDRADRDTVGAAWEKLLKGKGYSPAGNARFLRRFRASPYVRSITRYAKLRKGSLILEPGCGSGKFSLALASLGHQVVTLDYVIDVLRGLQTMGQSLLGQWPGQISGYCQGSLASLPFSDSTFDLVMNEGVVEHWLDERERICVLHEMTRVSKPEGVVAVLVPNGVHPLARRWESEMHSSAPPMTSYSASRLGEELQHVGLQDVHTDGIYPWRSWMRLSPWRRFYIVGALLDHLVPLPKNTREKWGINLIGLGTKASGA